MNAKHNGRTNADRQNRYFKSTILQLNSLRQKIKFSFHLYRIGIRYNQLTIVYTWLKK